MGNMQKCDQVRLLTRVRVNQFKTELELNYEIDELIILEIQF